MSDFRLPDLTQHTAVVGRNGSGKTMLGVWLLSWMPIDKIPVIVLDYKRERLFRMLGKHSYRGFLTPDSSPPKKPGLYLMQPTEADDEAVDRFFWRVWQRAINRKGGTAIYIDEAYMVPSGKGSGIRALLTQGRSLKCPVIALAQRPVGIDRFYLSEASFLSIFHLVDRDDRLTVRRYCPMDADFVPAQYHSLWYDAPRNSLTNMLPVPSEKSFLERLRNKAPRRLWFDM